VQNKIQDLRNHLFATLEALRDTAAPMDIDRARAISEVAGRIIDSAKAETDRLRALDSAGVLIPSDSDFMQLDAPRK
jgi:hypothetical protein